ncbi:glycosyltransferase family 2 protein [Amorphus orientalis]|uniref:glycosyltransferase family 2 protein n=1 Tax=Amorphus orientalis TaxID=649198 RepID=UPI0027D7C88F|nr:glycosyltransferase family 2 protein [Amorphus orientalis]
MVIPAKDEAGNLPPLLEEIQGQLAGVTFEAIVVDDGSDDGTDAAILALTKELPWLRLVRHEKAAGKSAALRTGVKYAHAPLILMIDGDGQNNPIFLPKMLKMLQDDPDLGLVVGQRLKRHDSALKQRASKLANGLRSWLLGDKTRDTACGLKAIRRELYLDLPFFDTMHRFFPALVLREGWQIAHIDVEDRVRIHGSSKYGVLDRALVGLPDLFGVWWLLSRRRRVPSAQEATIDADR